MAYVISNMRSFFLKILMIFLSVSICRPTMARSVADGDSTVVCPGRSMSTWVPAGAGALLVAGGSAGRALGNRTDYDVLPHSTPGFSPVDVIQYAPLAFPWVMKLAGAETRSGWGQMAVSNGVGAAVVAGSVYGLKRAVNAERPDGSDNRSFPSGHTAWAFFGATVLSHELGYRSPWYTVGAYTVACGVGISRVIEKEHFPTDVVAGAGIGIIAGQLGYYVGDLIFGNGQPRYMSVDNRNRSSLSISTGMAFPLNNKRVGDGMIKEPAVVTALQGSLALSDRWGVEAKLGLETALFQVKSGDIGNLNSIGLLAGGYYRRSLSTFFDMSADLSAGCYNNIDIDGMEDVENVYRWTPVGELKVAGGFRVAENTKCQAAVGYRLAGKTFDVERGATSSILIDLSAAILF